MKSSKSNTIMKILYSSLIDLPTPSSINFKWNFGSLLGLILMTQLISGIFLTFHYAPEMNLAFNSIILTSRNNSNLWLLRWIHANGASLMFFMVYFHIARNIYFSSPKKETWISGVTIFLLSMSTAFLGYVLPWGQMSFWGVTVITNLLSAIPFVGNNIVIWLWGGFSVQNPTLNRFFSLHFLMPFILSVMVILHLIFLHYRGSSNPLNLFNKTDMIQFHPFFSLKDLMGLFMTTSIFLLIVLMYPLMFNDPENFVLANPMVTPIHIQPEWYFLFAYAILRSIPNKIGGVIALLTSILILYIPPFIKTPKISPKFSPLAKILFWNFSVAFLILTWIGMKPVSPPFSSIGVTFSFLYFFLFTSFLFSL